MEALDFAEQQTLSYSLSVSSCHIIHQEDTTYLQVDRQVCSVCFSLTKFSFPFFSRYIVI